MKNKVLACEACGFKSTLIRYEDNITEEELLQCVDKLNNDPDVDGFIVQLPLPKHINEQKIIEAIDYRKDVDGFHPINVGALQVLKDKMQAKAGDLILILSGDDAMKVRKQLCELRLEMGTRMGLRDKFNFSCLWVIDFPMYEWSDEEQRLMAMHR